MLKFAANLSWLFKEEANFVGRYQLAAQNGFKAVESADPYNLPLKDLVDAKASAGVEHVLMNAWPGESSQGELGLAAIPGRQQAFRSSLETSVKYCKALNCKRLHIMAGRITDKHSMEDMRRVYVDNLKYAAEYLSKNDITGLIEPVNSRRSVPGYFMDTVDKAVSVLKEVNHPGLKLQMDLYHVQIMHGNLTSMLKDYLPYVGHMQIAQIPERHEPDSAGEVNYEYIFDLLEKSGYDGYIGLEYIPAEDTVKGLSWFHKYMKDK